MEIHLVNFKKKKKLLMDRLKIILLLRLKSGLGEID